MAYQILHQKVKRALNIGDSGYRSQRLENVAVSGWAFCEVPKHQSTRAAKPYKLANTEENILDTLAAEAQNAINSRDLVQALCKLASETTEIT